MTYAKVDLSHIRTLGNSNEAKLAELQQLLKPGKSVYLENGRARIIVPGKIVEVRADSFLVQHGDRQTVSKFASASFVQLGRSLILRDSSHCYSHVAA